MVAGAHQTGHAGLSGPARADLPQHVCDHASYRRTNIGAVCYFSEDLEEASHIDR